MIAASQPLPGDLLRRRQRRRRDGDEILVRQRIAPALLLAQQDQVCFFQALQVSQRSVGLRVNPAYIDRIALARENVEDAQRLVELAQFVQRGARALPARD